MQCTAVQYMHKHRTRALSMKYSMFMLYKVDLNLKPVDKTRTVKISCCCSVVVAIVNSYFYSCSRPSREEVQEWGISFEKLLTSKSK